MKINEYMLRTLKRTHIKAKTIERRKKNQLGWHPAFHPSMLLIILKATRVCMGQPTVPKSIAQSI